MPARTVKCTLKNESKHDLVLVLDKTELDHGIWTGGVKPPGRITAGGQGTWASESHGFMTGTEGTALYTVGDTGAQLKVYWDNPFIGTNEFTQTLLSGSRVSDYVPFDPMRPHSMKTPAPTSEPAQFEHGNDIVITYRFIQQAASAEAAATSPTARPNPNETRVASVPASTPTTVQCPAGARKVVYVGLTTLSAAAESQQLAKQMQAADLTIITPTSHSWVEKDRDFESRTPLLNSKRQQLKALEDAEDLVEWTGKGNPTVDKKLRIFAIRSLAAVFAEADPDVNPKADCLALKRLCISGHHGPGWTKGRDDVLWGSPSHYAPPTQTLTLFRGGDKHGIMAGLADIFPKAFAQVEDFCFSACYTAHEKSLLPKGLFKMFKNLKTLWGYENFSPNAQNVTNEGPIATSSNRAICDWEKASRPAGAADDLDKASRELRKAFKTQIDETGKSVIWDKGTMRKVD